MGKDLGMTKLRLPAAFLLLALLAVCCGKDGTTAHFLFVTNAEWSPASAGEILISRQEYDVRQGYSSGCASEATDDPAPLPAYDLWFADTSGKTTRRLTTTGPLTAAAHFEWSHAGDRLLVWDNSRPFFATMDTNGSFIRYDSIPYVSDADYAPDGSTIVTSAVRLSGVFPRLYLLPSSGAGGLVPIGPALQAGAVAWSPADLIAFTCIDTNGTRLALIHPNGSGLTFIDSAAGFFNLRFSPDGSTLLYTRKVSSLAQDVVFYDVAGASQRLFLQFSDGTQILSLRWSPDGTMISYYARQATNVFVLYVINADGTDARQVAQLSTDATWSPDSRRVAYVYYNKLYTRTLR